MCRPYLAAEVARVWRTRRSAWRAAGAISASKAPERAHARLRGSILP